MNVIQYIQKEMKVAGIGNKENNKIEKEKKMKTTKELKEKAIKEIRLEKEQKAIEYIKRMLKSIEKDMAALKKYEAKIKDKEEIVENIKNLTVDEVIEEYSSYFDNKRGSECVMVGLT